MAVVVAVTVADVVRELVREVVAVVVGEAVGVVVALDVWVVVAVDSMQSAKLPPARNEATASFSATTMLPHALGGVTAIALPNCTFSAPCSPIR